jgi:chemosensory pili system protein ChpA (sensor histidine kinase/response regulator)
MKHKILVVDDNLVMLKVLSMKLTVSGYQVLTAVDGSEAVRMVRNERPDLILLDIGFPPDVAHGGGVPWDGFLILKWLKHIGTGKDIPVFIITGGQSAQLKEQALAAGALRFFRKPFDNDELLAAIQDVVGPPTTAASSPRGNGERAPEPNSASTS